MTCHHCTDDLPCEGHMEILIAREGASLRTADELKLQFIEDAREVGESTGQPIELAPWGQEVVEQAEVAIATGDRWLPGNLAEDLETLVNQVESEVDGLGLSVFWDDGFLIYRDTRPEEEVGA